MHIEKLLLSLILFGTLVACGKSDNQPSPHDVPILVSVVTNDKPQEIDIPQKLSQTIQLLEINESKIVKKELGYPARLKIKAFNVAAFAKYKDGWLVASGRGEWGGVLFWIDNKGNFEIIRDDDLAYPIDIIADGDKLFLIQGMAHLSIADGHMLEIVRENGKFSTDVYPINGYPTGFKQAGEDWIIAVGSNDGYYVLSELRAGKDLYHDYK